MLLLVQRNNSGLSESPHDGATVLCECPSPGLPLELIVNILVRPSS